MLCRFFHVGLYKSLKQNPSLPSDGLESNLTLTLISQENQRMKWKSGLEGGRHRGNRVV